MKKLIIKKIDKYIYTLTDGKREYNFNFEIYDVNLKENDIVYIHDSLLNKNHELLAFGPLEGIYGKNVINADDKDLLIINQNNNLIYLKRYYG